MQSNHNKENENRKIAILGKTRRWMRGFIEAESYRNALKKKNGRNQWKYFRITSLACGHIHIYAIIVFHCLSSLVWFFSFLSKKGRESLELLYGHPYRVYISDFAIKKKTYNLPQTQFADYIRYIYV